MADRQYWAAKPPDEIVDALRPRVENYYSWLLASGRRALWSRCHRQYYSGLMEGGVVGTDGEQDEQIRINVNDFRNLIGHLMVMTSGQRPYFTPRASNSDHKSQTQTILAQGILDYVLQSKGLEATLNEALETCLLFGDAFVAADWDATAGQDHGVMPDGQSMQKTGDLAFRMFSPMDLVRDFMKSRQEEHQWYISRRWANRYDLMARYPELADRLAGMPTKEDNMKRPRYVNAALSGLIYRFETDDVEVFDFVHGKSDAMPMGRKTTFLLEAGDAPPLFDGPLPYDDVGLYRLSPAPMLGTSHGYTSAYDLLGLNEASNALWSTIGTNLSTFGTQVVWVPEGSNIGVEEMTNLSVIKSRVKPEGLNLTAVSPDTYHLLELITKAAETVSGVNSVARGNPEASLKSGSALALVQAQALQFSIGLQKAWVSHVEAVATGVINLYKRFAELPQVALLVGRSNKGYLQEFTSNDLDRIDRVSVELGNPLGRTVAGRVQIAELLGNKGLLHTPEEYIQVLTTGRLEPVLEATQKEMLAIKAENERLSDTTAAQMPPASMMPGAPPQPASPPTVQAMLTDNHPAHIREHASVIASPESRDVPAVVNQVLAHIQQHIELWQSMPPALGVALQIQAPPPPPPPPGMPPPGAESGPPHQPPANPRMPPGPPPPESMLAPPGATDAAGPLPNMPQMPQNALTGERAPGPSLPT